MRVHQSNQQHSIHYSLALLSSKFDHIQRKTNRLVNEAARTGLKANVGKCKVLRMNAKNEQQLMIGNTVVEDVAEFTYLGAKVNKTGRGTEDIKCRLGKAWATFRSLNKIWHQRNIGRRTKMENMVGTDPFSSHDTQYFSTEDDGGDNDKADSRSCAKDRKGGWWFYKCAYVCLNCKDPNNIWSDGTNWETPSRSRMWIMRTD